MRNDRYSKHHSSLFRNCIVLLMLIPFSARSQSLPQSGSDRVTIHGYVDISTNYNDNILEYSAGDITKFGLVKYSSMNWKKYSIDRLDDFITVAKFRVGATLKLIDNAPTSIWLRTSQYLYHTSHIRNYGSWQAQVRQYFFKKNYFTLTYNTIPRYYLRNYWYYQVPEQNPYRLYNRYVEAYIGKQGYSFDIGRKFNKRFSAEIGYEHEYVEYNREFSERNNHRYNLSLSSRLKMSKVIELSGKYSHTQSWADGRNNPDSTIADISYKANRFSLGLDLQLRSILKIPLKWSNNITYENQSFFSNKITEDIYHYGRKDKYFKIVTELTYRILKNLNVFLQYYWEENKTNLPATTDAGNYQTHQIGGGIKVSF